MNTDLISVVLPTWNRGYCISQAIRSILDQTYKNWELIIINDGSTDNTEEVVESYDDLRIRHFKTKHQGIPLSRNFGYSKTKGQWILDMDSDDRSFPDRIDKLIPFTKKYDVIYSGLYMTTYDPIHKVNGMIYVSAPPFNLKRLIKEHYIPGPSFIKKKVWEKWPYRQEVGPADDWMAYLDWGFNGYRFKNVDIGLYEYIRNWDSSTIKSVQDKKQEHYFNEIKRIIKKEYGA